MPKYPFHIQLSKAHLTGTAWVGFHEFKTKPVSEKWRTATGPVLLTRDPEVINNKAK